MGGHVFQIYIKNILWQNNLLRSQMETERSDAAAATDCFRQQVRLHRPCDERYMRFEEA